MRNHSTFLRASLALFATFAMSAASAQENRPGRMTEVTHRNMQNMGMAMEAEDFQKPIDYLADALGTYNWEITTSSEQAQNYFKQGMQLRWAYNINEAARSMAEARRLDPECAMCYWGEAFALGSFLNGGMNDLKAPYAHEAIEKAVALADNATEKERDLIMAARVRYPADYDPDNRRPVDVNAQCLSASINDRTIPGGDADDRRQNC